MIMGAGHVTPDVEFLWAVVLWTWPFMTIGGVWLVVSAGRGVLSMNGFLMLAGVATVVIGLCMFAVGWGALPS